MYKKEIRDCKLFILFCLFAVAYGSGNFVWGVVSGRMFSIVGGIICALVCGFCAMRSIRNIESYTRMEKDYEDLMKWTKQKEPG